MGALSVDASLLATSVLRVALVHVLALGRVRGRDSISGIATGIHSSLFTIHFKFQREVKHFASQMNAEPSEDYDYDCKPHGRYLNYVVVYSSSYT